MKRGIMKQDQIHIGIYSNKQLFVLTFLRILIGWNFLYEGLIKIYTPGWTAKSYLLGAVGPFSSVFRSITTHEQLLRIVDLLNEWGLVIIGLCLFIGMFSKVAKMLGIFLLLFYYLAYPPFAVFGGSVHMEGSYWVVNKNLIEMAAIAVLYLFPTSHITGIDKYLFKSKLAV